MFGCIALVVAAMFVVTNAISGGPGRARAAAAAAVAPTTAPSTHTLAYTCDAD
jgi:hypothetical protein